MLLCSTAIAAALFFSVSNKTHEMDLMARVEEAKLHVEK
jgi:hypothetical protein